MLYIHLINRTYEATASQKIRPKRNNYWNTNFLTNPNWNMLWLTCSRHGMGSDFYNSNHPLSKSTTNLVF